MKVDKTKCGKTVKRKAELYLCNWDIDIDKCIKTFLNNRFSDYGRGPNRYPTRMDICGCELRTVYYGFSGTYEYYINGVSNLKRYQPGNYLIKRVIKDLKYAAENIKTTLKTN